MPRPRLALLGFIVAALVGSACSSGEPSLRAIEVRPPEGLSPGAAPAVYEARVRPIPLAGPLAYSNAEISGLAWYGDDLIILPQYPGRFNAALDTMDMGGELKDAGLVFKLERRDIMDFLTGRHPGPLRPEPVPFAAPGLAERVAGFDGYEAICFDGDEVFLAIESQGVEMMQGYLVAGTMDEDEGIRLDAETLSLLPPQTRLANLSYETLVRTDDGVLAIQEANGAVVNPVAKAYLYDGTLRLHDILRVPTVEYRITDATDADRHGRFWAFNYFYPGDRALLRPAADSLSMEYGWGASHQKDGPVERLIELRIEDNRVVRTPRPPIQLELVAGKPRNWEGLVRLGHHGFLAATDRFPATMLVFIAAPPAGTSEGSR